MNGPIGPTGRELSNSPFRPVVSVEYHAPAVGIPHPEKFEPPTLPKGTTVLFHPKQSHSSGSVRNGASSERAAVLALAVLCLTLVMGTTSRSAAQSGYAVPPAPIPAVVDAERAPRVLSSPDGRSILFVESHPMPTIRDMSRRMLRLAGLRIDPAASSRFTTSYNKSITLRGADGKETAIAVPADARLSNISWSHDSQHFAFTHLSDTGTALFMATVDNPKPVQVIDRLATVLGGYSWLPSGSGLICRTVDHGAGKEPQPPRAPNGPNIQETAGEKSPLRTYQDLLKNQYDADLFEYHATSRIARVVVGPDQVDVTYLGDPALYTSVAPSPDGAYLLVTKVDRPFSYLMPYSSFPTQTEVWTRDGRPVRQLVDRPLAANIPIGGVQLGPRSVHWMPTHDAALAWVQALDGGDPKNAVPLRDEWRSLDAPFQGDGTRLLAVEQRARGLSYLPGRSHVIASMFDRDRRWSTSKVYDLSTKNADGSLANPLVIEDRSVRDRYNDPGSLVSHTDERGRSVVRQDGEWIYRRGSGVGALGTLPFLSRQSVKDGRTEILWRCEPGQYETALDLHDAADGALALITRHESSTSPPNYRRRIVGAETFTSLTEFVDPTPQIRDVHKEVVKYTRKDGVALSATLYLPAGYDKDRDGPLPLLIWAYPREFNDPKTAGQVTANPWRFTRIGGSSHLHLLTQGYAIMDGATMPIIGDAESMNDTFLPQLVSSAEAAIDEAVRRGVADRNQVAVGGHSYGAFMTANLLAHCDLFAAGIARSGAYNRTLTPFGFQSERRTLWEAPESYFRISPFMHAHKIKTPILMIHGEADNNSGTFPVQSRRLFQAIKGNGGTARLVMLPYESHGYRARESVLHTLAEMHGWMETHVKNRGISPAKFKEK